MQFINNRAQVKKACVLLYGTQNILPALIALKLEDIKTDKITFVIRQHNLSEGNFQKQCSVIRNFLHQSGYQLITMTEKEWRIFYLFPALSKLRKLIISRVTHFILPHDLTSDTADTLRNALKPSHIICYGDGYGIMIDKIKDDQNSRSLNQKIKYLIHNLSCNINYLFFKNVKAREKYTGILPVCQINNYKKKVLELTVPSKSLVINVLRELQNIDVQSILSVQNLAISFSAKRPIFIFLLENFSEFGFTSKKNEIQMYEEIILKTIPEESNIILKSHPWSDGELAHDLIERLRNKYNFSISTPELELTPIELWPISLLGSETVFISMSTPAVTLKYFFNHNVIQPLTEQIIEDLFFKHKWETLKLHLLVQEEVLNTLDSWDGTNFIYSTNRR
jgi:hypothetical protein